MNYTVINETALIESGLGLVADRIKLYVHRQDPALFDLLNFEADPIFLEPMVNAHRRATYINNGRHTADDALAMPLRQILYGYIKPENRPATITAISDGKGWVYLPNLGYFKTTCKNTVLSLTYCQATHSLSITQDGQPISARLEPLQTVAGTGINLYQCNPTLLNQLFNKLEGPEEVQAETSFPEANITTVLPKRLPDIEKAFAIIRTYLPEYHHQLLMVAKGLMVFENPAVRPFATGFALGISFISTTPTDSVIYFIVELIHQFGHNMLYAIMADQKEYFLVDPMAPLAAFNYNPRERRTIFSAFHGLFTTTKIAECLEVLYHSNVFEGDEQREIVARLADNRRRFRTGIERIEHDRVLTPQGLELYEHLDSSCAAVYRRLDSVVRDYNVSNQPFMFTYSLFKEANPSIR
ncbi:HEXXH motif-containing putative peptide modification protein [Hymenobacter elongatus]|nr:HEXXH motif-containing putative peptide modification protein [Hymenobacter elongatus]